MGVGKRIKEAREKNGLTQAQLAKKIGITPSSITNYENGTSHPKEKILYDLMSALSVDANFIFQDEICIKDENTLTQHEMHHIKKYRSLSENDKKAVDDLISTLSNKLPFGYNSKINAFEDADGARAYLKEHNIPLPLTLSGKEDFSDNDICIFATEAYKICKS